MGQVSLCPIGPPTWERESRGRSGGEKPYDGPVGARTFTRTAHWKPLNHCEKAPFGRCVCGAEGHSVRGGACLPPDVGPGSWPQGVSPSPEQLWASFLPSILCISPGASHLTSSSASDEGWRCCDPERLPCCYPSMAACFRRLSRVRRLR